MRTTSRWFLPLIGSGGGLLFGLTYWFAWGCRNCAKDNTPYGIVAFSVLCGAVMAHYWGKDHIAHHSE